MIGVLFVLAVHSIPSIGYVGSHCRNDYGNPAHAGESEVAR